MASMMDNFTDIFKTSGGVVNTLLIFAALFIFKDAIFNVSRGVANMTGSIADLTEPLGKSSSGSSSVNNSSGTSNNFNLGYYLTTPGSVMMADWFKANPSLSYLTFTPGYKMTGDLFSVLLGGK